MSIFEAFDFSGKVALVTGGSRGLGLAIAETLGELGARLALVARNPDELAKAASQLAERGIDADVFSTDIGVAGSVAPLVDAAITRCGRIDILINNAAGSCFQPAEEHDFEGWRKVMAINIDAAFQLAQAIGRREFIPRRAGKIVNIASIGGLLGNRPEWRASTLAYNTSKGALINFTRALAAEWGPHNINVNALCPGFFRSRLSGGLLDKLEEQVIAATPLGRLAEDRDLSGAVAFLCSEAARNVTGQMLTVDGGMTACY